MSFLKLTCPHCLIENQSFTSIAESAFVPKNQAKSIYSCIYTCGACEKTIIAEIECITAHTPHRWPKSIHSDNFTIIDTYPQAKPPEAPQHLPDNIHNFYLQAANNCKADHADSCVMMARKTLEVALKKIAPDAKGNLYQRIEALANDHIITTDLKDWAHVIREDGNDAAHEEEPLSLEFAKETLAFTEMFLMYTFTLPGMLKAKKKEWATEEAAVS